MKLVVDSNIFISSLDPKDIFHSECYPLFERILAFDIEALCPALVLSRRLARYDEELTTKMQPG